MNRLLAALRGSRVLLMDGAMGTELQRAGLSATECSNSWNLTHPERVRAIHLAYGEAGARVLVTNTFQANPIASRPMDLPAILRAGTDLACHLPFDHFVLQSTGPIVGANGIEFADLKLLEPLAPRDPMLDGILLETCSSPRVRFALRRLSVEPMRWPVLLSLTFRRHERGVPRTFSGHAPEWFARRAAKWGAAALGVNCGLEISMDEIIAITRRYRDHTDLPLFARPNAGTPTRVGDRWVYPHTPEKMAQRLPELLEAGVRMIGGCCGTTPEHIAAFRPIVEDWNARASARPAPLPRASPP
jgi:5-methyltetrahydrofolate--homocysteine methyltransferase